MRLKTILESFYHTVSAAEPYDRMGIVIERFYKKIQKWKHDEMRTRRRALRHLRAK